MTGLETFVAGIGVGAFILPYGFWFWLILIGDFLWLSWLVSDSDYTSSFGRPATGGAFGLVIATLLLLQYFTKLKVLTWIVSNPALTLVLFTGYVLVGVGWSLIKWTSLLLDWRSNHQDRLKSITKEIKELSARKVATDTKAEDIPRIDINLQGAKDRLSSSLPTASENKSRITAWIAYWPWSLIWTFAMDYITRFFQHIFQMLETSYNNIQKRILKDFYKD